MGYTFIHGRVAHLAVLFATWKFIMFAIATMSTIVETVMIVEYGDLSDVGLWIRFANILTNDIIILVTAVLFVYRMKTGLRSNKIQDYVEHIIFILYEVAVITTFVNAPLIWNMPPLDVDEDAMTPFLKFWSNQSLLIITSMLACDIVFFGTHIFTSEHWIAITIGSLLYFTIEVINRLVFDVRAFEELGAGVDSASLDLFLLAVWQIVLTIAVFIVVIVITSPHGLRHSIQSSRTHTLLKY
jgi:hypothetical protein